MRGNKILGYCFLWLEHRESIWYDGHDNLFMKLFDVTLNK
jgi:hypothetical protein